MALTYAVDSNRFGENLSSVITSNLMRVNDSDLIVVMHCRGYYDTPATIANDGTAITWNSIASSTGASPPIAWYGWVSGNRYLRLSVTISGNHGASLYVLIIKGAHPSNPIPSGNIFLGNDSGDNTLVNITPTKAGSMLFGIVVDYNNTTWTARTNNTLLWNDYLNGSHAGCVVAPTTQPLTDTSTFAWGETNVGGAGLVSYIAFEVQSAPNTSLSWTTA
jgi:hypothetical protein